MVPLERDFNDFHAILTQVLSREQGSPEESVEHLPMELTLNLQSSGRGGKESRTVSGILSRREERLNRGCEGSYLISM